MSELKPCPFCGGEAAVFTYNNEEYDVKCRNPYCLAKSSRWDTEAEAIDAWNTRTDDYKQAAEYWQRMYEQSFGRLITEEIVRCSDCAWFANDAMHGAWCKNFGASLHDDYDGFCAWGVKKNG